MQTKEKPRRALQAALELHSEFKLGTSVTLADPAQVELWKQRNHARMSLLNDSWPHKNQAFRFFAGAPCETDPCILSGERLNQHEAIIEEEYKEMWYAVDDGDIVEFLDGALDLIYTVLDFLIASGFSPQLINAAYEEIHASNMTKADDDGKAVILHGKIQKTSNYVPPNLKEAAAQVPPFLHILGE